MVYSTDHNIRILLFLFVLLGRTSINRTPDALSSMDCIDDHLVTNQTGRSITNH